MVNELFIISDLKNETKSQEIKRMLSTVEQKMQTLLVQQKMSTLNEEGRLRQVSIIDIT